jgi:DNA-binding MarR family transcriptional regulator
MDRNELKDSATLGYLVNEVGKLFKRRFEEAARAHGVTLPQWRTLAEISRNEGTSQAALAAAVDSDPMTMSGVLDRLEKRGLIERFADPHDSRAKAARITPAGRELMGAARELGLDIYRQSIEGVDPAEQKRLTAALTQIRDNLNAMSAEHKETA